MGRQFILANFPSGSAIKPESIIVFWQLVLQVPYLECVGYSAGESNWFDYVFTLHQQTSRVGWDWVEARTNNFYAFATYLV